MMALLIGALCFLAGLLQSRSLERTARGNAGPLTFPTRLLLVVGALLGAAWLGHIWAGALGWACGFFLRSLRAWRRWA